MPLRGCGDFVSSGPIVAVNGDGCLSLLHPRGGHIVVDALLIRTKIAQ